MAVFVLQNQKKYPQTQRETQRPKTARVSEERKCRRNCHTESQSVDWNFLLAPYIVLDSLILLKFGFVITVAFPLLLEIESFPGIVFLFAICGVF